MDLGGEALGAFKANQGGCTQIQVSPCLRGVLPVIKHHMFQFLCLVFQRGIRKSQVSAFFQTEGMTQVENRNRKMHQSRMRHGVLQVESPRQCLHPNPRPPSLTGPTPRIRFLDSPEVRPGVTSIPCLWMDRTMYISTQIIRLIQTSIHNHYRIFRCDRAY